MIGGLLLLMSMYLVPDGGRRTPDASNLPADPTELTEEISPDGESGRIRDADLDPAVHGGEPHIREGPDGGCVQF